MQPAPHILPQATQEYIEHAKKTAVFELKTSPVKKNIHEKNQG